MDTKDRATVLTMQDQDNPLLDNEDALMILAADMAYKQMGHIVLDTAGFNPNVSLRF